MSHSIRHDEGQQGINVPAGTLDRICHERGLERIALVKINIEGAERSALEGMTTVISRVRNICVACHDFKADRGEGEFFRTREFVEGFLRERGFALERRTDDPRGYVRDHVVASRP
jgi:hypothetical protein